MNEAVLALNPFLAVAAIFINFIFALLVLLRTSRSFMFMIFLSICLSVIYWNFCVFMAHITGVRAWFYLSMAGSAIIPPLMFHFVVALVRPGRRNAAWLVPAYGFSCLLGSVALLALAYPWAKALIDGPAWDVSYMIFLFPLFLNGLIILLRAFRKAGSENEKNRLWYILLAGVTGVLTAVTDHVHIFTVPAPALGHLGSVFYPSILAVGVFRHRTAYDILAQTRLKIEVMNELTAGIAHEIRNPLTSIKGALKLFSSRIATSGQQDVGEYIELMSEEIDRLDAILINFQCLTRPLRLEKEAVRINDIIVRTVRLAEVSSLNTLSISSNLYTSLPAVIADPLSLKQVFLNLIKNAAEACSPKGDLLIRTEYVPPWVKISFADNGPGIPQEGRERVFDAFFTTKEGGMGMGLAISRRLIEAQGGLMELGALPGGACFSVLLPAEKAAEKGP